MMACFNNLLAYVFTTIARLLLCIDRKYNMNACRLGIDSLHFY